MVIKTVSSTHNRTQDPLDILAESIEPGVETTLIARGPHLKAMKENGLRLRIYGTKAGLDWAQEDPNYLHFAPLGQPPRLITRNGAGAEAAFAATRWRNFSLPILIASGIGAAIFSFIYTWIRFDYGALAPGLIVTMFVIRCASGALLAGDPAVAKHPHGFDQVLNPFLYRQASRIENLQARTFEDRRRLYDGLRDLFRIDPVGNHLDAGLRTRPPFRQLAHPRGKGEDQIGLAIGLRGNPLVQGSQPTIVCPLWTIKDISVGHQGIRNPLVRL